MIISMDAEKILQHLFNILKNLSKNGNKGNISQHNKGHIYDKLTANNKLSGENLKAFP